MRQAIFISFRLRVIDKTVTRTDYFDGTPTVALNNGFAKYPGGAKFGSPTSP